MSDMLVQENIQMDDSDENLSVFDTAFLNLR